MNFQSITFSIEGRSSKRAWLKQKSTAKELARFKYQLSKWCQFLRVNAKFWARKPYKKSTLR